MEIIGKDFSFLKASIGFTWLFWAVTDWMRQNLKVHITTKWRRLWESRGAARKGNQLTQTEDGGLHRATETIQTRKPGVGQHWGKLQIQILEKKMKGRKYLERSAVKWTQLTFERLGSSRRLGFSRGIDKNRTTSASGRTRCPGYVIKWEKQEDGWKSSFQSCYLMSIKFKLHKMIKF